MHTPLLDNPRHRIPGHARQNGDVVGINVRPKDEPRLQGRDRSSRVTYSRNRQIVKPGHVRRASPPNEAVINQTSSDRSNSIVFVAGMSLNALQCCGTRPAFRRIWRS